MEYKFITITGVKNYYSLKPFSVGKILTLKKEPENAYDNEAIKVTLPSIDTVGYVANSAHTVYAGTMSAGRIYDKIANEAHAVVMFITHSSVIAAVLPD